MTQAQIQLVSTIADTEAMSAFFMQVWADGPEVVPFDLALAVQHVGGYSAIATLDGKIVGASFGFQGAHENFPGQRILHSHVTAATVPGVGFALKQHQKAWAIQQGIDAITWTFDPLVRRNAVFNFEKLGAIGVEYLPNFYGTMTDAIKQFTGFDISGKSESELFAAAKGMGIDVDETMGKGKLIDEIFGAKCEGNYIQPTFITDYPKEMSPLCKQHRDNPELTERFELMVCGKEVANAYSELNDPIDQRERFEDQMRLAEKGDDEANGVIDEDFLRALEYGMPPTSGLGIGMDRLMMFLTNNASIQEVLFFPQMRPEKKQVQIELTEEEKLIVDLLKANNNQMDLAALKAKSELSGKKWDAATKGLSQNKLIKVSVAGESKIMELIG